MYSLGAWSFRATRRGILLLLALRANTFVFLSLLPQPLNRLGKFHLDNPRQLALALLQPQNRGVDKQRLLARHAFTAPTTRRTVTPCCVGGQLLLLLLGNLGAVPLARPQRRQRLKHGRPPVVDVGEVRRRVGRAGSAPGDELRAPALVDVAEAVQPRTRAGDGREELFAAAALLGVGHVEDAAGRAVRDGDVGPRGYGKGVA